MDTSPNRFEAMSFASASVPALAAIIPVVLLLLALAPSTAKAGAEPATVKISGTAYAFFGIDDRIPGAVVRVEEFPGISDTVAVDGSYEISVPDDANVTPYIEVPAGYRGIYLQTFHTSGQDLKHVNFQVVPSGIYAALAGLLGVPLDDNGQVQQCVIVSTFSIHEARDATTFDPGFKDVYPHGLPGSTATIDPLVGDTRGPIYFNSSVIPDPAETASSVDGGVLWAEVPPGYYWLEPAHPTERLAPFLAHCEDGRLINANPPWGFYELRAGEEPDPAVLASPPDVTLEGSASAKRKQRQRAERVVVRAKVKAGEDLTARARGDVKLGKKAFGLEPKTKEISSGNSRVLKLKLRKSKDAKKIAKALRNGRTATARLNVKLSDGAGNKDSEKLSVRLER